MNKQKGFTLIDPGSKSGVTWLNQGFTLIELLVVVAIIALLLSIIVPSLRLAKAKASSVICLTNVKNISLGFFSYQEANRGRIPSAIPTNIALGARTESWIGNPVDAADVFPSVNGTVRVTDEDEIRGIERGVLFEYLKSAEVFHCPFDRRTSLRDQTNVFRTYSMPDCLYGYTNSSNSMYNKQIKKFGEISSPGMRIVVVEEVDERNFNYNGWTLAVPELPGAYNPPIWNDPLGVTHGDSSTLGFCDGHAEVHKWVDSTTKDRTHFMADELSRTGTIPSNYGTLNPRVPPYNQHTDIDYIYSLWPYRAR
ncbi:MAG: type II secretion system protein [Planctomycetaceae bacterium]|nr:type II secretion system protein [Planctomycetaceae bacterium]